MGIIRAIFRFIRRLIVLAVIIAGGYLYFNNTQVQATTNQSIWALQQEVAQFIDRYLPGKETNDSTAKNTNETENKTTAKTDTTDSSSTTSSGRWTNNTATVYINTGSTALDSDANSALEAWNRTGAFTFKRTTNEQKADIVVSAMNNGQTNAAGLTKTSTNSITKRFVRAKVYLNVHYLTDPNYGYTQERIINTAEHELGHAIGLEHTNAVSVMQPAGSFYTIQPRDVEAVKQLYDENN